jgi:DNA-binding transcriptional regulator GbsR (MarR family)
MDDTRDGADAIRRDFATGWARVGAAWGIAPSTAAVQGWFLVTGGPLTENDLRAALGLSHKAALSALGECERWGLIQPADPVRTGSRGPAGRAWIVVGDHWEWFRRVAASRKERETDPIVPLLEACVRRADHAGDAELQRRLASLAAFARDFDASMGAIVAADSRTIASLVRVLARLGEPGVAALLDSLAALPEDDLVDAGRRVGSMKPGVLRRLVRLASQPGIARMLDRLA